MSMKKGTRENEHIIENFRVDRQARSLQVRDGELQNDDQVPAGDDAPIPVPIPAPIPAAPILNQLSWDAILNQLSQWEEEVVGRENGQDDGDDLRAPTRLAVEPQDSLFRSVQHLFDSEDDDATERAEFTQVSGHDDDDDESLSGSDVDISVHSGESEELVDEDSDEGSDGKVSGSDVGSASVSGLGADDSENSF